MEEITFIHDESARYLLILLGSLVWLTALSLASRISRLPPRPRALVNLLSLATGPVGWSVHAYSWYQGRQTPPADAGSESLPPSLAPRPVEEAVATKTAVALATIAAPAAASQRKFRISAFVSRLFGKKSQIHNDSEIFNGMMLAAVEQQATDIHLECHEDHYLARVRVNGILRDLDSFPRDTGERLVSIAKVLASLNVADKLKPQDGRLEWTHPKEAVKLDVRVSVSPSLRGEKLALRFLNRPASAIDMASLGMNEAMQRALKRAIRHPEGFILIAGPTGSGKTSTAYSLLSQLAGSSVNIMTIEDPVEYTLPYATQIAINAKLGVTFQTGLTTLLRQDPDIILIGEMRDPDSFHVAIRASLSGHLVISTMHARDSVQVFANLRNLGIETSSLAAAVKLVVAQRLVRVLCPHCKIQDTDFDEETWTFLGGEAEHIPVYQPGDGCDHCFRSGFSGRTGIFEFIRMDSTVKEWLENKSHETDLRRSLIENGFRAMREDAREKVLAGYVWAQDAIRAAGMDAS